MSKSFGALVLGAVIAGIVGVITALAVRKIEAMAQRRMIARAVFVEMIQALVHMLAVVNYIDDLFQKGLPSSAKIDPEIVRMLRPLERKVVPVLGAAIAQLSEDALANVVAFEGTLESETRRMREPSFTHPDSLPDISYIRDRTCGMMKLVTENAEIVARDGWRWRWQTVPAMHQTQLDAARAKANSTPPTIAPDPSADLYG